MRLAEIIPLLALCATSYAIVPEDLKPCQVISPHSKSLYDLNKITVTLPDKDSIKETDPEVHSWYARGHDYGANFTINFCAPVVEDIKNVVGVDEKLWKNVSAFYKKDDKIYSIG